MRRPSSKTSDTGPATATGGGVAVAGTAGNIITGHPIIAIIALVAISVVALAAIIRNSGAPEAPPASVPLTVVRTHSASSAPSGSDSALATPEQPETPISLPPGPTVAVTAGASLLADSPTEIVQSPQSAEDRPDGPQKILTAGDAGPSKRCTGGNVNGAPWKTEPVTMTGINYATALTCTIEFITTTGSIEFQVPAAATYLEGMAGMPTRTGDRNVPNMTTIALFRITDAASGAELFRWSLAYNNSAQVNVPVAGLARIRLEIAVESSEISPREQISRIAWADMKFTTR